jgi:hypothetical protein
LYYVRRIIKHAKEKRSNRATLVKILFSGLQMNAISLAFAFQFEGFFEEYMTTQNAVSSMGTSALSLDCLWATSSSTVYPFYVETLVYMISPLVLLGLPLLILAVWFACNIARPNASAIRERVMAVYFAGVVVVLFVAHPTLTTRAMKLFQCIQLADKWHLKEQLEEECWSTSHMVWVSLCGIPMLLVYVVGIPASAFVILYRNRAAIPTAATAKHEAFHNKFSFLYKVKCVYMSARVCKVFVLSDDHMPRTHTHTYSHTTGLRSERPQAPTRVRVGDCGYHAQGVGDVRGRLLLRKPARARYACLCVCIALLTLSMFLRSPTYDSHPCTYTQHVHAVNLGLVVIMSALCLQIKQNPFESDLLNRAETVCIKFVYRI